MGRRDRANRIATLFTAAGLAGCGDQLPVAPDGPGGLSAATGGPSALAAPSNATAGDDGWNQAVVRWQDNSNETGFEVQRATTASGPFIVRTTVGANTVVFTDSGLDVQTPYCYRIRAVGVIRNKPSYSAFSNIACVPAPVAPTIAPSQLTAVAISETRIDLTWQDNSTNESSFEIVQSWTGETGNFFHLATASANAATYSHQWLTSGSRHCYQVRAVQAVPAGDGGTMFFSSEPTAIACATTLLPTAPPAAAYAVSARPLRSSAVELSVTWTLASPAPLFRIERSTSGGALWTPVSQWGAGGTFWDQPVASEAAVCYRIVAFNAAGDAAPSLPACTTPPAAPTLGTATVVADSLELVWGDNSAVEEGYEVWAVVGQGSPCAEGGACDAGWYESESLVAVLAPNSTSWRTAVGVPIPFSSLGYYVVARKDGGRSDSSALMVVW